MAVLNSNFSLHTGTRLLGQMLSERINAGKKLNVTDQHILDYLSSKSVADQYPTHTYGSKDPNAGFESLAGRVMNTRA